jgi:membrane protein
LLSLAFFIVLVPLIINTAVRYSPTLEPLWSLFNSLRISAAAIVLVVALLIVHKWLPAGRRSFMTILPGIAVTLALWLIAGELFGDYLSRFAYTYVSYYAGLASAMIALVFLYVIASIFILGGELNAAIMRWREAQKAPFETARGAEG